MKKFISALLVVMMLVAMIPATVLAATETATITFDNTSKRTTYTTEQQVWVENNVTVTNNKSASTSNVGNYSNPARFYKSSELIVEFPMNMTQIVFTCGSTSYATAMANSITSGATVTTSGSAVTAVLDTPATSFTVAAMSAQVRVASITVTYEVNDAVCLHEETETQGYVAPTCTTEGATGATVCVACGETVKESEVLPVSHEGFETYVEGRVEPFCETEGATGITYCSNCDEVVAESTAIPAAGHNYDGDTCTVCGATVAVVEEETYVFSSYAAGAQYAENEEHVLSDLVTMYTTQAHFTTELRLYSSSSHDGYAIIQSQLPIKGITINAGNKADTVIVYGSNDQGATWTEAAQISVTATTYNDYSASLASTPYTWLKLDVKGTQQVRIKKMTLQFVTTSASECDHSLTETIAGTAATCTTAGQEDTLTCLCGQNVQVGAEIPALGHSYADDYCAACNSINPEAAKQAEAIDGLPVAGDQVIFYYHSSKVAMGTAPNNDRMSGVNVTKANGKIPYSASATAVMTVEQVGEYFRFRMGDQYLTTGATGSTLCFAALPAEGETDLTLWAVTPAATYTWGVNIRSVNATYNGTDYNQTIEYYNNQFYPYGFNGTTYAYSYQIQIGLVNKVTLTADVDGLTFEGKLKLDLNGYKATNVVADELVVWDSSATATTAGTGSLTTECAVTVDNTVEGVRYIALKDDAGVYTFHVLQLKLDTVTLRTNKAGVYYKASMACDEVLAGQIDYHGVAVSIVGAPTAAFESEANTAATKIYGAPESVFTSGSVTNIFRENLSAEKNAARGEMAIYADSYIKLYDGTVLMGENDAAKSLKDIMTYLDTNYASLSAEDQANALSFYQTWTDSLATWELANLAAAAAPETEEVA